jgi:hypothetical protein
MPSKTSLAKVIAYARCRISELSLPRMIHFRRVLRLRHDMAMPAAMKMSTIEAVSTYSACRVDHESRNQVLASQLLVRMHGMVESRFWYMLRVRSPGGWCRCVVCANFVSYLILYHSDSIEEGRCVEDFRFSNFHLHSLHCGTGLSNYLHRQDLEGFLQDPPTSGIPGCRFPTTRSLVPNGRMGGSE